MVFRGNDSNALIGYTDADYGNDINDRKSNSGHKFKVYGDTMSWSSKKQKTVALSSTEAEFLSVYLAICELLHLYDVLDGIPLHAVMSDD